MSLADRLEGAQVQQALDATLAITSEWSRVDALAALAVVVKRARAGLYADAASDGVHLVGLYWHFLLATWFAILVVLMI